MLGGGLSDALHHTQLYGFHIASGKWYRPNISPTAPIALASGGDSKSAAPAPASDAATDSESTAYLPTALCVKHRTCILPPPSTAGSGDSGSGSGERVLIAGGGANCFSFGTTFNPTLAFQTVLNAKTNRLHLIPTEMCVAPAPHQQQPINATESKTALPAASAKQQKLKPKRKSDRPPKPANPPAKVKPSGTAAAPAPPTTEFDATTALSLFE